MICAGKENFIANSTPDNTNQQKHYYIYQCGDPCNKWEEKSMILKCNLRIFTVRPCMKFMRITTSPTSWCVIRPRTSLMMLIIRRPSRHVQINLKIEYPINPNLFKQSSTKHKYLCFVGLPSLLKNSSTTIIMNYY